MELNEVQKLIDNLSAESRSAITELIDIKTNDNMKEVITEIRSLKTDTDSKFKILYWVLATIGTIVISSCISLLVVFLR